MKKVITLFSMLALAAHAQISYVNLVSPSTNTLTYSGTLTVTNQFTNSPFMLTDSNNIIFGDTPDTAFTKINADLYFLWNWDQTNNFGTGGGGGSTNDIPIINGGGLNLTVTNTFTLTSTNPYYTIASIDPTNLPADTPGNGPLGNPTCTNRNGPYYPAPQWGAGAMTNACGYVLYLYTAGTNPIIQVTSIWVTNGYGIGYYNALDAQNLVFTNTSWISSTVGYASNSTPIYNLVAVVSGGGDADSTGTYFEGSPASYNQITNMSMYNTNNYGVSVTNRFIDSGAAQLIAHSGLVIEVGEPVPTNLYVMTIPTVISNGFTYSTTTILGPAPAPTITFYFSVTNGAVGTNFWSQYLTNAWRFYEATNVTFTNESPVVSGTSAELFNVTNTPLPPNTNVTYIANNGNPVIFYESPESGYYVDANGNVHIWGTTPATTNITITILNPSTNAPPGTNAPPPVVPAPIPGCDPTVTYITATINHVRKFLVNGNYFITTVNELNQTTGIYNNELRIDATGFVTLTLAGATSATGSWTSSQWTTTIPACAIYPDTALPYGFPFSP